jgi:hypothetical protein
LHLEHQPPAVAEGHAKSPRRQEIPSAPADPGHYRPSQDEAEASEPMPSIETLRDAYERFRSGDTAWSHSHIVQYVRALESENRELAGRCSELEQSLRSHAEKAYSFMTELDPGVIERMTSNGQPSITEVLVFFPEEFRRQWNVSDREIRKQRDVIDRIKAEKWELQQRLDKEEDSHRRDIGQLKHEMNEQERKWESIFIGKDIAHKGDKDALRDKYEKQLRDERGEREAEKACLQDALATTADQFEPISDRDLKHQFSVLRDIVGTLARSPLGVDAEKLGQAFAQTSLVQAMPRKHYKFVLESVLWAILIDGIFLTPFKVFGDHGERFAQLFQTRMFKSLHLIRICTSNIRTGHVPTQAAPDCPQLDVPTEKWRSFTFELLRARLENTNMHSVDEDIKKSYEDNVSKVSRALRHAVSQVCPQGGQADIRDIVNKACSLALDFGMQRCRLRLIAPRLNETVSRSYSNAYKDVNDVNNLDPAKSAVKLVVWPGLRKTGDAHGGRLEESVDLYPAGVYLC